MSDKNDGGNAFPWITDSDMWDGSPGMTLRDWLAGQALAGMCANKNAAPVLMAQSAYQMADAMLAERDKETSE